MTATLLARPARRTALAAGAARPSAVADTRRDGVELAPLPPVPTASTDLVLPADLPLHVVVARAQLAERTGRAALRLTGPQAAAVASRLLRLTRTLTIAVELDLTQGARGAALDAVALARVGGGRVQVLVRGPGQRRALNRELGRRPRARASRFGGDAFAAVLPTSGPEEVAVAVAVLDAALDRSAA